MKYNCNQNSPDIESDRLVFKVAIVQIDRVTEKMRLEKKVIYLIKTENENGKQTRPTILLPTNQPTDQRTDQASF